MIDPKILREDPERVRANCVRRGATVAIDDLIAKDQELRSLLQQVESLRSDRNRLSKESLKSPEAREQVKLLKVELEAKEARLAELKVIVHTGLTWLPNFLAPDVPDGASDKDNRELRKWGEDFWPVPQPKDHQALGESLGLIDTTRGAKVAQSGFYYWRGAGAQLTMAMFFWAQQELVKRGFTLMMTPCVAREQTLFGTGYLPFFADQTFKLDGQDLSLIGTSEQTLVAYHRDEVLPEASLPRCYAAFTPCFRTEAGSYGKETRGIFRVHQFHKVEQIIFCKAEESEACHLRCLENEEYLLQELNLPYRVVNVCVGDMGAPGYKKYDIEAWFPGYGGYREVTSNTNLTDFQSRRLGIRWQDSDKKRHFVHTISATGVTDRVVCAILENYQQADGSVLVPAVLRPYCGMDVIRPA